jgi:hypothetical protein
METIKKLIQCGLISHDQIMEYIRDYHESIDWEADQMEDSEDNDPDHLGEDVSGTFEEPKLVYRALFPEREIHPDDKGMDTEYVLLSTAYEQKETYVFPSNEHAEHLSWEEIIGIAERNAKYSEYDEKDWLDTDKVLAYLSDYSKHTYELVKSLHESKNHKVLLYKRTDL